jgi:hypothetical protein
MTHTAYQVVAISCWPMVSASRPKHTSVGSRSVARSALECFAEVLPHTFKSLYRRVPLDAVQVVGDRTVAEALLAGTDLT